MNRFAAWLLLAGCAASHGEPAAPTEKPPITIAVIGLGGTNEAPSKAEDGCAMALLEAGYRVVDHAHVVMVLPDENDVDFSRVGKQLGADLIIDGGIARGSGESAVRLEPRLISIHSANVLGTARAKGRVKPGAEIGKKLCAELLAQLP